MPDNLNQQIDTDDSFLHTEEGGLQNSDETEQTSENSQGLSLKEGGLSKRVVDQVGSYVQRENVEPIQQNYSQSDLGRETLEEQRNKSLVSDELPVNPMGKDGKLYPYAPGQGVQLAQNTHQEEVEGASPELRELPDTNSARGENPYNKRFTGQKISEATQVKIEKYRTISDPKSALLFLQQNPDVSRALGPKEMARAATEVAKDQAKKKIKEEGMRRAKLWLARSVLANPYVLAAIGIAVVLLAVVALVVGLAIGTSSNTRGDNAPSSFGVGGGGYEVSEGNPEGIRLRQMSASSTLDFRGKKLGIESTSGRSAEEKVAGSVYNATTFTKAGTEDLPLTAYEIIDPISGATRRWTQEEVDYYIAMRWPYTSNPTWPGGHSGEAITGYAGVEYYAGRRLIVFDPVTKKAVVVVAAEYGPAGAAGACHLDAPYTEEESSNDQVREAGSNYCETMSDSWKDFYSRGVKRELGTPENYYGRIMGFPPIVYKALGLSGTDNNKNFIVGWAADQTLAPGPLSISDEDILKGSLAGSSDPIKTITANINALPVIGIAEGEHKDCGEASMNMVLAYYVSNKGIDRISYDTLPSRMRAELSPVSGQPWSLQTKANGKYVGYCVNEYEYLKSLGKQVASTKPFAAANIEALAVVNGINNTQKLDQILKNSLRNGHPAIIYTKSGSIYSDSKHIYVVTGYDNMVGSYVVNNPSFQKVAVGVTSPNGKLQTSEHLLNHITKGSPYKLQLIVNKNYCRNIPGVSCNSISNN